MGTAAAAVKAARASATVLVLAGVLAGCAREQAAEHGAGAEARAAARIAADVRFLADDRLGGRATGSEGYRLAAEHVVARMQELGLQPAGDNGGYLQRVPLLRSERQRAGARFAIEHAGTVRALEFGSEFLPGHGDGRRAWSLRAPMLFVGYAVHAPALGHDDFDGAALHGRIAVALAGVPARFAPEARVFHGGLAEKQAAVAARGALGLVIVGDPDSEARVPWSRRRAGWRAPAWQLPAGTGPGTDQAPPLQAQARISAAAAEVLFAAAPMDAAQVFAAAAESRLRAFALPGILLLAGTAQVQRVDTFNVIGQLPGSDPARGSEPLLLSAHLDHLGVAASGSADRIRNGAIDNALGVAVLLDAARRLAAAPPRRPLLFAALAAEEHGLLGALHLAANPPGAVAPVANLNIDMPVLLGTQTGVAAIGAGHSGLGPMAASVAAALGTTLAADPFPGQGAFLRSDQYAFVRAGIPALYLTAGAGDDADAGAARRQLDDFLKHRYHRPGDDSTLPIDYPGAARLAAFVAALARALGDAPDLPRWNRGDFFGERFAHRRRVQAVPQPN